MNAEQPLLAGSLDHAVYDTVEEGEITHSYTYESEGVGIVKAIGPLSVSFFLQLILSVTTIFAAGQLGPQELAAATLAVCTFNITGNAVYQGMSTSLDYFCSQAYGAGKPFNVGMYFQRCSAMMMVITIFPLSFIWWFSGSILLVLIPDAELAMMAQKYLRIATIGAPGLLLFESGKRYLQAQHIFNASTYILLLVAPLNFCLNWLLVWHPVYGLGYIGAPIAVSITYWLSSVFMLLYVLFIEGRECWNGLDISKAFSNWKPMLDLALPGVIMVEAEYLAFELLTILAARFGTNSLAAQSIASSLGTLFFQIPFAAAVVVTTRLGHFVGMEDVRGAKMITNISYMVAIPLALFNFSIAFFFRRNLALFFTQDEEVLQYSDHILMLVAINQLSDTTNVLCAGVLRGQGRQRIGSILNLFSYYLIAIPLGYFLAFHTSLELKGLWIGIIAGVFCLAVGESFCIYFSNWSQILRDSKNNHDH